MTITTYVPTILAVANFLKKYVNSHAPTLKKYMGDGLFAALQLVVDLVIIIAEIISTSHEADQAWSDMTKVNTLNSSQINQISAAIAKFWETIGVTP